MFGNSHEKFGAFVSYGQFMQKIENKKSNENDYMRVAMEIEEMCDAYEENHQRCMHCGAYTDECVCDGGNLYEQNSDTSVIGDDYDNDYDPKSKLWRWKQGEQGEIGKYRQGGVTAFVADRGECATFWVRKNDEIKIQGRTRDYGDAIAIVENWLIKNEYLYGEIDPSVPPVGW